MVAKTIVEKFKKREREIGNRVGLRETQREWMAWYERQQAALREGRPFDEPTPGRYSKGNDNGKGAA